MKKITNNTHLEGYLWGHSLELRTSQGEKTKGTEYIAGTLEIATDDTGLNVVPVNFTFVTAKTKAGKDNATFKTLQTIMSSEGKTWQDVGEAAMKLKVDTALGVNDFYNSEGELVTYKRNDGGFVHVINAFSNDRNSFTVDMLITDTVMKEEDTERDLPAILVVKGMTFNFANVALPIDLVVKNPQGMKYFENLGASPSEPVFMKVWGDIICTTVNTETVEESAFGEASVKVSTRRLREWVITGAATTPYDYGDEAVLTKEDVTKAIAAREVNLAEAKKRYEEYQATKNSGPVSPAEAKAKGFAF